MIAEILFVIYYARTIPNNEALAFIRAIEKASTAHEKAIKNVPVTDKPPNSAVKNVPSSEEIVRDELFRSLSVMLSTLINFLSTGHTLIDSRKGGEASKNLLVSNRKFLAEGSALMDGKWENGAQSP